jgi:tetraacyldisaccharide-1-P 4'-kinase
MSADVISFPGDRLPDHQWTEAEIDKCHGDAFRDLEMTLRDCVRMSEIAAEMMSRAKIDDTPLNFAVFHLAELLTRLEKEYDARWRGERKS